MPKDEPPPEPAVPQGPPRISLAPRASYTPTSRWVGRDRSDGAQSGVGDTGLSLTPRMTAVFGGLFGLATVATIVALLIQAAPLRDERSAEIVPSGVATATDATSAPGQSPAAAPNGSKKRVRVKVPGPFRVADLKSEPGVHLVEDVVGSRSFITAMTEKGVPTDQTYRVMKAFESVRKFDRLGKKDRFIVALDRSSNKVRGFELILSPTEIFQAKEVDGVLSASPVDLQLKEEVFSGSFYVTKNLIKSAEFGGFEPDLFRALDEAFAGRFSQESLTEGHVVKVVATELTSLGEFVKYKNLVAVEVRPPDPAAAPIRAYAYQGASAKGYFDEKGRQPDNGGWSNPVPGAPITSRYNPKRLHPVLKKVMPHTGTDYGAPTGTPVYSVFQGKLSFVGNAGPCGNMVAIQHPNGIESGYCHLHKIAPGLKVGGTVGAHVNIGQVGTTGRSTGPHLHFWTKKGGQFFDSESLKIEGFKVIAADERPAFQARKATLDAELDAIALPDPPPVEALAAAPVGVGRANEAGPSAAAPDDGSKDESPDPPKVDNEPSDKKVAKSGAAQPASAPIAEGDGEDIVGPNLRK